MGLKFLVETLAGSGSNWTDADYVKQGAEIAHSAEKVWRLSNLILRVKPPLEDEIEMIKLMPDRTENFTIGVLKETFKCENRVALTPLGVYDIYDALKDYRRGVGGFSKTLFGFFHFPDSKSYTKKLLDTKCNMIALELLKGDFETVAKKVGKEIQYLKDVLELVGYYKKSSSLVCLDMMSIATGLRTMSDAIDQFRKKKELNITIFGYGASGLSALWRCLKEESKNIKVRLVVKEQKLKEISWIVRKFFTEKNVVLVMAEDDDTVKSYVRTSDIIVGTAVGPYGCTVKLLKAEEIKEIVEDLRTRFFVDIPLDNFDFVNEKGEVDNHVYTTNDVKFEKGYKETYYYRVPNVPSQLDHLSSRTLEIARLSFLIDLLENGLRKSAGADPLFADAMVLNGKFVSKELETVVDLGGE